MSFHSFNPWTLDDGADKFPADEVLLGIATHGMQRPPCYAILSQCDQMIYVISTMIEDQPAEKWDESAVSEFVKLPPDIEDYRKTIIACILQVMEKVKAGEHKKMLGVNSDAAAIATVLNRHLAEKTEDGSIRSSAEVEKEPLPQE